MLLGALAGTVVYLDTSVLGQTLLGQPIVACVLYGMLVDRPEIGLFFGVIFEMLWLANLQIGAAKFSEGSMGAIIATAVAASVAPSEYTGEPAWIVLLLSLSVGLIFSHVGRELSPIVRKIMNRIAERFVDACARGETGNRWTFAALGTHVAAGFVFSIVGVLAGRLLLSLYFGDYFSFGLSESVVRSTDAICSAIWPGLLGAGSAAAMIQLVSRKDWTWVLVLGLIGGFVLI